MYIKGKVKVDLKTKDLVKRLSSNDIAVICHEDLDELAAQLLIEKKVKVIVNAETSITGKYPNKGPSLLLKEGITIIDHIGKGNFEKIAENDFLEYKNGSIFINNAFLCKADILTRETVEAALLKARERIESLLDDFLENTLQYAHKEKNIVLKPIVIPDLKINMRNRHVLVVARGRNYKEDLRAIRPYIEENNPILIGVDGGADALLESKYDVDIVVGDMDSVSDEGLRKAKERVVHAYPDGRSPGLERISRLNLDAKVFAFPGTSEDIAMVLAYECGASLIVAVGTHSSMLDFLEKGRKGMASTLLIRMKIGSMLVDARGVGQLYRNRIRPSYIIGLIASALFPLIMVIRTSPAIQHIYRLVELQLKLLFGRI
ncbi:MAG: putative cytokinetic ring protein SteA [Clostridia bacterium]